MNIEQLIQAINDATGLSIDIPDEDLQRAREIEVRGATQPRWPFEVSIGGMALLEPEPEEVDEEGLSAEEIESAREQFAQEAAEQPTVLYIDVDNQIGYLPGAAAEVLGWS